MAAAQPSRSRRGSTRAASLSAVCGRNSAGGSLLRLRLVQDAKQSGEVLIPRVAFDCIIEFRGLAQLRLGRGNAARALILVALRAQAHARDEAFAIDDDEDGHHRAPQTFTGARGAPEALDALHIDAHHEALAA